MLWDDNDRNEPMKYAKKVGITVLRSQHCNQTNQNIWNALK